MAKCNKCGTQGATIPDRDYPSGRKKVCQECHKKRLEKDMEYVLLLRYKQHSRGDY